jgi:hypothetical protein
MPNENRSFAGKVAFVTGAANGIGRALEGRQDGVFLEALATLVGASVAGFGTRPGTHLANRSQESTDRWPCPACRAIRPMLMPGSRYRSRICPNVGINRHSTANGLIGGRSRYCCSCVPDLPLR